MTKQVHFVRLNNLNCDSGTQMLESDATKSNVGDRMKPMGLVIKHEQLSERMTGAE